MARGWVYVISNPAMPGLVKIGYSAKDPELRARELNGTGVPHPYQVEYDVLTTDPYRAEQEIHKSLHAIREGREWFRCDLELAVSTIRSHLGENIIIENCRVEFPREEEDEVEVEVEVKPVRQAISYKDIRRR